MSATRKHRSKSEWLFLVIAIVAVAIPLLCLAVLLGDVVWDGGSRIDLSFLSSFPSRKAELAGILPGLVGSVYLVLLTAAVALPIGIGAAVYLEEYSPKGRLSSLIEVNVSNLAGVPSIIYGLLGLGVFVRVLGMGRSLVAGALTMALLVLPMVVVVSREALRTVPNALREASLALGATRLQTIRKVVLPSAYPAILTGVILSISRALGETAPLVVIGALTYVTFIPDGIDSPFTVLPIQIFNWVSRPQEEFLVNAAAGIVVLMGTMLVLNATAIFLRARLQRRIRRT